MFKRLIYLLGIAATIIIGTMLYQLFCCNCGKTEQIVEDKNTTAGIPEINSNPFVLQGSGIDYQCNDNFNFLQNNAVLLTPASDSIVTGLEKLKEILIANPNQKITITGYTLSNEKNTTTFENLGFARAQNIKAFLVSKGLPKSQLQTNGEIVDAWKMNGDTLAGPLKFQFNELQSPEKSDEWSSLKDQINANPLVLHFNTNKSSENLSKDERQKVIDIVKYSNHFPDAKIQIVGHSDNTGGRDANVKLAQKRADFTKNYLVKNGVKSSNIETSSVGPDNPDSDNTSAEGKAKNRRTVITIK